MLSVKKKVFLRATGSEFSALGTVIKCGNKLFCKSFLVISSSIATAPLSEQCAVGKIYVRLKKICINRRNAYHQ